MENKRRALVPRAEAKIDPSIHRCEFHPHLFPSPIPPAFGARCRLSSVVSRWRPPVAQSPTIHPPPPKRTEDSNGIERIFVPDIKSDKMVTR